MQRKTEDPGSKTQNDSSVPPIVHEVLRSPGQPLDADLRSFVEPRFGHDFSQVRIHHDEKAAVAAAAVNARAFTVGRDVVFGREQYAPRNSAGRGLLAHELAHVVQQAGAVVSYPSIRIGKGNDASEKEAQRAEQAVSAGSPFHPVARSEPPRIQRDILHAQDDPIHKPLIEQFRRKHGLPLSGVDRFGHPVGPSAAEIKYGLPSEAAVLSEELKTLIDSATWPEIRKRIYPKESAAGIKRAKDRHAGTLPELSGLGRLKTLEHFATAVRGIQTKWPSLSPGNRAQQLGKAANDELLDADVPGFLHVDKEAMLARGLFIPSKWWFLINEETVKSPQLSDEVAADVTNTTLHESRHAEQSFLAARFSAGVNNKDADAIVVEQDIPKIIAKQAVAKKFDSATDPGTVAQGQKMFQAEVTDAVSNQATSDDAQKEIKGLEPKRKAAQTAQKNLEQVPTAQTMAEATAKGDDLRAQIEVVERKYALYRRIPYEADAHEVGDAAEQAFRGWP